MPALDMEIIERTRDDPGFYALMGPLFGSRAVARELGMPLYDDPGRTWFLAIDADGVLGCASMSITRQKAVFKSAYVLPSCRGRGIYAELFARRLTLARERGVTTITATATALSRNTHLRHGFREVGRRGKYYLMRKDLI